MNTVSCAAEFASGSHREPTTLLNDGRTLRIIIAGVEFSGCDFDSLKPASDTGPASLSPFCLHRGELCDCRIDFRMPLPLNNHELAELAAAVTLGKPSPRGGLDEVQVQLTLNCQHGRFESSGSGWFEDELNELQTQLPEGVHIRACINCLFADYSPAGHGAFGSMLCFRNIKQQYRQVAGKRDFWAIHDQYERLVQETYLCDQFERRQPGAGYRG